MLCALRGEARALEAAGPFAASAGMPAKLPALPCQALPRSTEGTVVWDVLACAPLFWCCSWGRVGPVTPMTTGAAVDSVMEFASLDWCLVGEVWEAMVLWCGKKTASPLAVCPLTTGSFVAGCWERAPEEVGLTSVCSQGTNPEQLLRLLWVPLSRPKLLTRPRLLERSSLDMDASCLDLRGEQGADMGSPASKWCNCVVGLVSMRDDHGPLLCPGGATGDGSRLMLSQLFEWIPPMRSPPFELSPIPVLPRLLRGLSQSVTPLSHTDAKRLVRDKDLEPGLGMVSMRAISFLMKTSGP